MKKILMSLVLGLAVLPFLAPSPAGAFDVNGPSLSIRVEKARPDSDKFVKFTLVDNTGKSKPKVLGKAEGYSLEALRSQRHEEKCEVAGSVVLDAALLAALAYAPYSIILSEGGGQVSALLGLSQGSVASGGIMSSSKALNPIEQYKEADALNEKIITDKTVKLETNKDVENLAERLELVLKQIES
jgi:hypothetical protein